MPSKPEHILKAQGNEAFVSGIALITRAEIDWALVAIFYAAVHYVEAYFSLLGEHSRNHVQRERRMEQEPYLESILEEYNELKFYALRARYEFVLFSASDVTDHALPFLARIRSHLAPFLFA